MILRIEEVNYEPVVAEIKDRGYEVESVIVRDGTD
jgi:hypothetical protein